MYALLPIAVATWSTEDVPLILVLLLGVVTTGFAFAFCVWWSHQERAAQERPPFEKCEFTLAPGDFVILSFDRPLSATALEFFTKQWRSTFPDPATVPKVMIVEGGRATVIHNPGMGGVEVR